MADRIDKLQGISPIQTALAQGYYDPEFTIDRLVPIVNVPVKVGQYPIDNKDRFKIVNTIRGIKADSNKLPSSDVTLGDYRTVENDAYEPVDYQEEKAALMYDLSTRAREKAQKAVMRKWVKDAYTIVTTSSYYTDGNYTDVTGTDQWDNAASDPISMIDLVAESIQTKSGVPKDQVSLFVGSLTFNKLKRHAKIVELYKYSQTGILNEALVANALGIKEIVVDRSLYSTDGDVLTPIWGKHAIAAYVNPQARTENSVWIPTFGYTLRLDGHPFADSYTTNGGKITNWRYTDDYVVKITSQFAGFLLTNVIS